MTEFQNLSKLMENMQLIAETEEKIKASQEIVTESTEGDAKIKAQEDIETHERRLEHLLKEDTRLRDIARELLGKKETDIRNIPAETESFNSNKQAATPRSAAITFKLPQPEKFKRGENFPKFCENFLEYITLSKFSGDNLHLLFLQLVDDFTKVKLKKVLLTPDQRKDAKKFTDEYIKKISPTHEGRTFKSMLADLKQKEGENIEEFSYRISDVASRAYDVSQELLKEEACFNSFMKGVMDPDLRMKLHEDTNITTFETATEEASRLETIKATVGKKSAFQRTPTEELDHILGIAEQHSSPDDTNNFRIRNQEHHQQRPRFQPFHQANRQNIRNPASQSRGSRDSNQSSRARPSHKAPIVCFKCSGLNHFARDCKATLN